MEISDLVRLWLDGAMIVGAIWCGMQAARHWLAVAIAPDPQRQEHLARYAGGYAAAVFVLLAIFLK